MSAVSGIFLGWWQPLERFWHRMGVALLGSQNFPGSQWPTALYAHITSPLIEVSTDPQGYLAFETVVDPSSGNDSMRITLPTRHGHTHLKSVTFSLRPNTIRTRFTTSGLTSDVPNTLATRTIA